MSFRINFNGQQVSGTFGSYAQAKREILAQADYDAKHGQSSHMWIQEQLEPGEWFSSHLTRKKKFPHLHRS